jgi:uncharacterized protein
VTDDTRELVAYRFRQARETLEAGRELFASGHCRDAINRAYYAMFYAAVGLLALRRVGSSKHAGVLSLFGRHFVTTGEFSTEAALHFRQAFELRQKCDCREFVEPEPRQAEELLDHADRFIVEAEGAWSKMAQSGSG